MITAVYSAIIKHLQTFTVETESGVYVDGDYVETLTATTVDLASFPLTFKDLRMVPEGAYTAEDRKFFEIGEPTLNVHDVVISGSDRYRIMQITNRNNDGGFSAYIGKREAKS